MSDATFYKWRSKHVGEEVSDAKKPKAVEAENAAMKNFLNEQTMNFSTLKQMQGHFLGPIQDDGLWIGP